MSTFIDIILGLSIFIVVDLLLEKIVFHKEFFNNIVRKHKNFQLFLRLFLIVWLLLTEFTIDFLKYNLDKPRIAWIIRGIYLGIFFRLINYKEKF